MQPVWSTKAGIHVPLWADATRTCTCPSAQRSAGVCAAGKTDLALYKG